MSVQRNPKDSMKSTWRSDKSVWTHHHWVYELLGLHPTTLNKEVPVFPKDAPIPSVSEYHTNRWVLLHAFAPLALHQAYVSLTGRTLHPLATVAFYSLSFILIGIRQINIMRTLGHKYGFLDGDKHQRDQVPDHSVVKVLTSLILTVTARTAMATYFTYSRAQTPLQMSWLALPVEVGLYGIVLDFWFYWYHRVMHHSEFMWKYHRTHHLTKHPNPLLTLYADEEQEIFDIVGIPLMAYATLRLMGLPMGFYEWWICYQYVVYAELAGHSGLRIHAQPPGTFSWLLRYFNCELVIEDHDLHHRQGWKKSHNYGKQTRLWDRVFGTCADRIESTAANSDPNLYADWPLY